MPAAISIPEGRRRTALQRSLLHWYDVHRRDLPWRRTHDPYAIWVAEIMLQQTRVAAVLEHYREFLRRFPTAETLARAGPAAVLAAWSGLGYYRRARALHAAAKMIVRDFGGRLPESEQALAELPGIGRYTAAAVASTAFNHPCAVVDGNVERVLSRLLGKRRSNRQLWGVAAALLSRRRPGDFNQALMEVGATVCLPRGPACARCPLRRWCASRGELPAAAAPARRQRRARYLLAMDDGRVFLVQRAATAALMPLMWELPAGGAGAAPAGSLKVRHSITQTDYQVTVVRGAVPDGVDGRWFRGSHLRQLPLTGLARKVLRVAGIHL